MAGKEFTIEIRGHREVIRAFDRLPGTARRELKDGSEKLARGLANRIRAAGRARGRQAARPARTVKVVRAEFPSVVAGPHPLLEGTEFGALARFGWYRKLRYVNSPLRQFPTHIGNVGYWIFPTERAFSPEVRAEHRVMAANIVRRWSA